jgi:hypothetical protein
MCVRICVDWTITYKLQVFSLSNMDKPSYVAEGLSFLPPILTSDYYARRSTAKATITELIAADIGDTTARSPHLIVSSLIPVRGLLADSPDTNFHRRPRHLQSLPLPEKSRVGPVDKGPEMGQTLSATPSEIYR